MDRKLLVLNLFYAVTDALLGLAGIALFGLCAWHFERWWISLFALLPLAFYNTHSAIIDADIQKASEDELNSKGGD